MQRAAEAITEMKKKGRLAAFQEVQEVKGKKDLSAFINAPQKAGGLVIKNTDAVLVDQEAMDKKLAAEKGKRYAEISVQVKRFFLLYCITDKDKDASIREISRALVESDVSVADISMAVAELSKIDDRFVLSYAALYKTAKKMKFRKIYWSNYRVVYNSKEKIDRLEEKISELEAIENKTPEQEAKYNDLCKTYNDLIGERFKAQTVVDKHCWAK
jgi:hypothetical protein